MKESEEKSKMGNEEARLRFENIKQHISDIGKQVDAFKNEIALVDEQTRQAKAESAELEKKQAKLQEENERLKAEIAAVQYRLFLKNRGRINF